MSDQFYAFMARITNALVREEEGQTAVEYALVLVLVAIVLAGSLAALNGSLGTAVTNIGNALTGK